jgi:DNA-binding response OmpR family regulator
MAGDRQKALDAGCDDYDTKPVNLKSLLEKMENLLS